jgi:uncharacterized protein
VVAIHVYLGHGASGSVETMQPWIEGLRERSLTADAFGLPVRKAEDVVPLFRDVVPSRPDVVVGGHSYSGRVASLAAAEPRAPYAALVLLSYPLHLPGKHETWDGRTAHWPQIRCPVLLLSGEADPFARLDLLRGALPRLAQAELFTYPRVGHGLNRVMGDALDRMASFLAGVSAPR